MASALKPETHHDFRLSQTKDWHRETIVANQKSIVSGCSLSSGTAENRAVCLGLNRWKMT